jgi:hypothetical protein
MQQIGGGRRRRSQRGMALAMNNAKNFVFSLVLIVISGALCLIGAEIVLNVRGEPIVWTPEDAFRCSMRTELGALAIGNFCLEEQDQNSSLKHDYKNVLEPD